MNTIVVVGAPGQGKSEFVKKFIGKTRNTLINDIQDEYGMRTKYPGQIPIGLTNDTTKPRCRYIGGDIKQFIQIVEKKRNTVCVFEEATIFFEGRIGHDMRRILINKMFTRNVYILCFHSISSIPPKILQFANYVIMFKTNDEEYQVERKYPSLAEAFKEVKTYPDGKYKEIKML